MLILVQSLLFLGLHLTRALILIVDDSPDIRDSISELLSDEGFSTVIANDGLAALTYLQDGKLPDVILLDLQMPQMDGIAFREHQLAHPLLREIPVVVMTAMISIVDEHRLATKWVLRKPFAVAELLAVIGSALNG